MLLSYSIKDIKIQLRRITNTNLLSWIYQSLNGELPLRTSVLFAAFCSFVAFAHVGQKCSNLFSLASMSKFMNPNFSHIFGCMIGAKNILAIMIHCVLLRIVVGLDSGCVKSWLLLSLVRISVSLITLELGTSIGQQKRKLDLQRIFAEESVKKL